MSTLLTGADGVEQIVGASISPNLLPLLGVRPVLGRSFSAEEVERQQRLVLISHAFWNARFAGSPDALGASLVLNGVPFQIVGVLPAHFQVARLEADVWEPHTTRGSVRGPDTWFVIGRLRPGVTFDQAQAEMSAVARRLNREVPAAERNRGISVVPLRRRIRPSRRLRPSRRPCHGDVGLPCSRRRRRPADDAGTKPRSVPYHPVMMRSPLLILGASFLIIVMAVSAQAQTAPQAPLRQFLLRIEPVRAGFTLQNMTEEEQKAAVAHLVYLRGLLAEGKLTLAGQAFDPNGFFGIIVVNAPDLESASRLLHGDPFVKANLFRGDVTPFRTALERGAPDPLLASVAETGKADLVQALLDVAKPSQKAIDDAYERALEQKRVEVAAVLKKVGAHEPAPSFETDPKVLEGYAGNYASDNVPLTIKVFVKDGKLFMQAAGQSEFPLKALSATEFEFRAAGVQARFASDGSFSLKQGGGSYLFKRVMNR